MYSDPYGILPRSCPNLIQADLLPSKALSSSYTSKKLVNLTSGSGYKKDFLGILDVDVRVGSTVNMYEFIISGQLHAYVLLSCQFIEKAVDSIHIRQKSVEFVNGETLAISRQRGRLPQTFKIPDNK